MRLAIYLFLFSTISVLAALVSAAAVGQEANDLQDWFLLADTDRDGQITLAEWRAAGKTAQEFKEWDRNDDGIITLAEFAHFARLHPEPRIERQPSPGPDPTAIMLGKSLFTRNWTANDPLCDKGDGLGPVFNAVSCSQCHFRGGLGGSGGLEHNVTTFVKMSDDGQLTQGTIHGRAIAPKFQENLSHAHPLLPGLIRPSLGQVHEYNKRIQGDKPVRFELAHLNTPALFGAKLIDELPDRVIAINEAQSHGDKGKLKGRAVHLPDGKFGKFGWRGQSPSLLEFVQAACANELGLSNPGHPQPAPLTEATYKKTGLDLTLEQCQHIAAFIASLPRPIETLPEDPKARAQIAEGRQVFVRIGCAGCHVPNAGPIEGVFSDFLLHAMGKGLSGGGSYGRPGPMQIQPDEWRTPPLWGIADSHPYLHDGRAPTLHDAIKMHGGQGLDSAKHYEILSLADHDLLHRFLKSLKAPG